MIKYNIEEGIDFYAELYKSLDMDNDELTEDDNNRCLITNELLTDKYITMECGHKFNYKPLYNDLVNHKQKFNVMEKPSEKLGLHEIRCPYCRNKQSTLLPYYQELGIKKINGINSYKEPNCEYQFPNENYDPSQPESDTNSKYNPSIQCEFLFASSINQYNPDNPLVPITYGDTKCYCLLHKKIMIKQYKTIQKYQEKEKKKQAMKMEKEKVKKQAIEAKIMEKKIAKEEKLKAKTLQKQKKTQEKMLNQNIVLGPSNISVEQSNTTGCIAILKSGPNKGKHCGCKIKWENMCARHMKVIII
jgi:hypothetical protein